MKIQLETNVVGVIEMITLGQIPEIYTKGTIGGVWEDLLAEEEVDAIKSHKFH